MRVRRISLISRATKGGTGIGARALHDVRTGRFERSLAGLAAAGAIVTTGEIYTSHDSASFGNKMMWWPVVVVPDARSRRHRRRVQPRAAKTVLPLASLVVIANGVQGTFLHLRGIRRKARRTAATSATTWRWARRRSPRPGRLVGGMGLVASLLRREGD